VKQLMKAKARIIFLILIVLFLFSSASFAAKGKQIYPIKMKDAWGHTFKFVAPPKRIILILIF